MTKTTNLIAQILITNPLFVVINNAIIAVRRIIIRTLTSLSVITITSVLIIF